LLIAALLPTAAATADESLQTVRDGYIGTLESIRSLWTRTVTDIDLGRTPEPGLVLDGLVVEWAFDGKKRVRYLPERSANGQPTMPNWQSSDGEMQWGLSYQDKGDATIRAAWYAPIESTNDHAFYCTNGVPEILGMGFSLWAADGSQPSASIRSLLEQGEGRVVGREEIAGASCWRVELPPFVWDPSLEPARITVWFDPEESWWPRQMESVLPGVETTQLLVEEFQSVLTGNGRSVSFPRRAIFAGPKTTRRMEITDVRINETLSDDIFRPRIPAGVPIIDTRDERARRAFYDSLETAQASPPSPASSDLDNLSTISSSTDAGQPRQGRWSLPLFLVGLGCIGAALVVFLKQRAH
jgi:hypothetical protein